MTPVERMASLNPGDSFEFAEYERWGPRVLSQLTIVRKTATMLVCHVGRMRREVRYRLATGLIVGDGYRTFPEPVTEEERSKLVREAATRDAAFRLGKIKWAALPLEILQEAEQLVARAKQA